MQRQRTKEQGNTIVEFAILMAFTIPMFAGAFTIGMTVAKGIQMSSVTRDAVILMVRSNTDPTSGLDLSQTQNQRILVKASTGLGMAADSQYNPSSSGRGLVVLTKIVMVSDTECSLGVTPTPPGAPPWSASNCPNYGRYVFAYRVNVGNTTKWSSKLGNPSVTIRSDGTVSASDIASNTSARAATFNAVTNMTLTASTYALIAEMYADISYLNFFSVLGTPAIYTRSIS